MLGKVLSPQFLIWLFPLVPLVAGRRGRSRPRCSALACVLTQFWFPTRYWELVNDYATTASWLVFTRDLVLLATIAVLVLPVRQLAFRRAPARGAG